MKAFLVLILTFPLLCFASFPIKSDFQKNDTIIINGKVFVETEVDSLSRYPIEKETLAQYKERLKKQRLTGNENQKVKVDLRSLALIVALVAAILGFIILRLFIGLFDSNSNNY